MTTRIGRRLVAPLLAVTVGGGALVGCNRSPDAPAAEASGPVRVDGERARALVAEGALLLDVRTPEEFAAGHLDGAVNIPVQVLADRLDELPDRARPVVVYCRSGGRSARAAELLRSRGFDAVYDLGGMTNW